MARQKRNPKDKKVEKPWERSDITMPIEEEFSIPRVQVRLTHFPDHVIRAVKAN